MRPLLTGCCILMLSGAAAADPAPLLAEQPVEAYTISNANAGLRPERDDRLYKAFGGAAGVARISHLLVDRNVVDPRVADFFRAIDRPRLERVFAELLCYALGGGCTYTGRDMKTTHRDQGIQTPDFNAVVENLQ